MDLTQNIAKRISSDGGGALIIDYGLNGIVSDSLQVWCWICIHVIVYVLRTCPLLYLYIIVFNLQSTELSSIPHRYVSAHFI